MKRLCLVLLAGLTACNEPDPRGVKPNEVLLQVAATGRSEVRPDEARITLGVSTRGPTAGAASAGNNAAMGRVVAALEQAGVKADTAQTRSLTVSRIDYGRERGVFVANNLVDVRIRDVSRISAAIAAATDAGANVVDGPHLRVADPERSDNAAYAAAYKAARGRADAYAAAAGLRVARVLAIRDGAADGVPIGYGAATDASAVEVRNQAGPPVLAGAGVREVRVRADFALAK